MKTPALDATKRLKICLASSHGGHLTDLLEIMEAFEGHDVFHYSYDCDTTRRLPRRYLIANKPFNIFAHAVNFFKVLGIFRKERPDVLVATGAELVIPVVFAAKLFRLPILFIECSARTTQPSWTGRVMYWLADVFFAQWPEYQHVFAPKALFRGSIIDEDKPFEGDRSAERLLKATLIRMPTAANSAASPPIELARAASVLEQHGCEVRAIDAQTEALTHDEVTRIVGQQQPDMVCILATESHLHGAQAAARQLATLNPRPVLVALTSDSEAQDEAFDFTLCGNWVRSVGQLAEGLIAKTEVKTVEPTPLKEPEDLPWPDWSLFPYNRYLSHGRRVLAIATSHRDGGTLHLRPMEAVLSEWRFLIERYGAAQIDVFDEEFASVPGRVKELCEELIAAGLSNTPWWVSLCRADASFDTELLATMKQAGCACVLLDATRQKQLATNAKDAGLSVRAPEERA